MAEYAKTQAIAAEKLGVSRATLVDMARHPDFPKPTAKGWSVDKIRSFAQKHARGPYRTRGGGKSTDVNGVTLTEANIRLKVEQAENERIEKERQLVEQAKELSELVLVDDVRRLYLQTVGTVTAVHDSLADAVDRAMPEACPSADAWPEIRGRVLALCLKLGADASAAMKELE